MCKNIVIVACDKTLRKDLSQQVAQNTKRLNIDADELLYFELLNTNDVGIKNAGEHLKLIEQKHINRLANLKNCVISMSDQLFLADDHFKLLKDLKKIYIQLPPKKVGKNTKKEELYRIEQELLIYNEINDLLTSICDIVVKADDKLPKISQQIIDKL